MRSSLSSQEDPAKVLYLSQLHRCKLAPVLYIVGPRLCVRFEGRKALFKFVKELLLASFGSDFNRWGIVQVIDAVQREVNTWNRGITISSRNWLVIQLLVWWHLRIEERITPR